MSTTKLDGQNVKMWHRVGEVGEMCKSEVKKRVVVPPSCLLRDEQYRRLDLRG